MDPFTIALATFGIQKLRGKSTKRSMRDAALAAGIGQIAGMAGFGSTMGPNMGSFAPQAFGSTGNIIGAGLQGPTATGATVTPTLGQQFQQTAGMRGIRSLVGQKTIRNPVTGALEQEGSGFLGLSPGAQLGIGLGASTLLAGDEEEPEMQCN